MGDVRFINDTAAMIYVAYMYRDYQCRDECEDIWNVEGWINLAARQTQTRSNPTNNRWFYYYAESGGTVWSGNYIADVRDSRFEKCNCLGVSVSHGTNPWYKVGMRALDLDQFGGVRFG
ncbi:MAG TPA: DUF1036 domain-containing protein [Kineosporiaceae bacterium]|nr:DUF1036 domain-containing protein [Kineosporiaceae bacterium]